jgi:hypothetical protein
MQQAKTQSQKLKADGRFRGQKPIAGFLANCQLLIAGCLF